MPVNHTKKVRPEYPDSIIIGCCPACGAEVLSGISSFRCRNYDIKKCNFILWKNCLAALEKKTISDAEMMVLLIDRRVINLDNLLRKDGERFSCGGMLENNRRVGRWGIRFVPRRVKQSSPNLPDRSRRLTVPRNEES